MSQRQLKPGELLHRLYPLSNTVADRLSYTTPLTNGSTWTSAWVDVSAHSSLVVAVKTDQDGIFYVDFSPDGTNVDSTLTRYYNTGEIEAPHRYTITRQFARVRFTNDSGSDQTYFRFQTILGEHTALNAPIDGTLARDFDATPTRPSDFITECALGLRQGVGALTKFGYNLDVDTGTETVWSAGGTYTQPTSAETLNVVSTAAADDGDPAGTGAQTLLISGLDGNYLEIQEVVTLNGTSNVTTTNSFIGINRISVTACGSGLTNAGVITATQSSSGTVLAHIPVGGSVTQQLILHTPADTKTLAYAVRFACTKTSGGSKPEIIITGKLFRPDTNTLYEVFRHKLDIAVDNTLIFNPIVPFVLPATSTLRFDCTTDTDNTQINGAVATLQYKDADQ